MKVLLLGTARDLRGFALAGLEGRACDGAAELEEALAEATRAEVGLVALSAEVAALSPAAVKACAATRPLIVLPEGPR
jgi:vacuolar-type H+-ATPase subunit F/Vma7